MDLQEFYESYKNVIFDGVKARTAKIYASQTQRRILPFFGHTDIEAITRLDVRQFVMTLEDAGLSYSLITDVVSALSRIFESAIDGELRATNPATNLRRKKQFPIGEVRARALTRLEFDNFLDHIEPGQYRDISWVLGLTGLRFGELAGLTAGAVNLDKGTLVVRQSIVPDENGRLAVAGTKSGRTRTVGIAPELDEVFARHVQGLSPHELVFTGPRGGWLSSKNYARAIKLASWREEVRTYPEGERPLTLHDLRHTACVFFFEAGVKANEVQEVLGHSSLVVTQLYSRSGERAAASVRDLMSKN